MADAFQFRKDTLANWLEENPVLAAGEAAYIRNLSRFLIGDGTTEFQDLVDTPTVPLVDGLEVSSTRFGVSAASADTLNVYATAIGGRMMLRVVGPSGLSSALQPLLARNKVGYWAPPGNATTVPGVLGYGTMTAAGTATSRSVIVSAGLFGRLRRLGYVSGAGAGQAGGPRQTVAQVATGDGTLGGFYKVTRFGVSDVYPNTTGASTFVGATAQTGNPGAIDYTTSASMVNSIGMAHAPGADNWCMVVNGSAVQDVTDLGSAFPNGRSNLHPYEVAIFCPPAGGVYWQCTNLLTEISKIGFVAGGDDETTPSPTTLLSYNLSMRNNGATARAVALDLMSDYIETDY